MIKFEILNEKNLKITTDEEIILEAFTYKSYIEDFDLLYVTHLKPNMYSIVDTHKKDAYIKIRKVVNNSIMLYYRYNIYINPSPDEYIFNYKSETVSKINLLKNNLYKQMKKPPILIGGLQGGGTSFIAKMLRFSGLFLGDDINTIDSRKHNESILFRDFQNLINSMYSGIIENGKYENGTISDAYLQDIDNSCKNENKKKEFINQLEYRFSFYIGSEDNINKIWGWKHCQNTKLSKFYKLFWPDLKLVIIHRDDEIKSTDFKTTGNVYYKLINKFNDNIQEWYNAPHISKENKIHVNFKELCNNYIKYNELLTFCGLNILTENEYNDLIKKTWSKK